jgi:hypothetical protein
LQPDITVEVELLDDLNPALTNSLWEMLPVLSLQNHAVVAGKQIYFPIQLVLANPDSAYTESLDEQPDGRVNFEPFFQYVSLNYGTLTEPVPAYPLGQIVEADVPKLATLGKLVWDNLMSDDPPFVVAVERTDEQPLVFRPSKETLHHAPEISADATWNDVLHFIQTETDSIWLTQPADVEALRRGVLASGAGVYGQYFSPWVMASGLVRSLGIIELATLTRLCRNDDFTVDHLKTLLSEMLPLTIGVMGFFGLPQLGATLEAAQRVHPQIETRADFEAFITALLTYVNRYTQWLHQTFPWYLGRMFPRADVDSARAMLDLASKPPFRPVD